MNDAPIFIVGPGRSGTTLIRSILSAHPHIAITPETHFLKNVEHRGSLGDTRPKALQAFIRHYAKSVRFSDMGVSVDQCLELAAKEGPLDYRSFFVGMLGAYAQNVSKPRVGEKTPGHVHYLDKLFEWFPDSRVIVMQRDPRAVVASQLRTPWVADRLERTALIVDKQLYQVAFYAADWLRIHGVIVPRWATDRRVMVVHYESLVQNTEAQVRDICAFLDEEFVPEMVAGREDGSVPAPAATDAIAQDRWREWRKAHHSQSLAPVSDRSLEKWKKSLSPLQAAMVEGWCFSDPAAARYEPASAHWQRTMGRRLTGMLERIGDREETARDAAGRALARVRQRFATAA